MLRFPPSEAPKTARVRRNRRHPGPPGRRPSAARGPEVLDRDAVGESRPALVEQDQPRERGEPGEEPRVLRHLPAHLDVRDPAGHPDEVERPLADDLVGDVGVAAPDVAGRRHGHRTTVLAGSPGGQPPCEPADAAPPGSTGSRRARLRCDGRMTGWEMVAVAAAGFAAGGINAVVGSGTLVTFPVLLAVGLPPVTATVSNSLGLVPGNLTGAIGYRRELRRPAAAADPAAPRLRARRADRRVPAPAPPGRRASRRSSRCSSGWPWSWSPSSRWCSALLARRRPAGSDEPEQHIGPGRMAALVRRRLRHRHLRRLLRRQPGRAADRHLRAAAAGVPAAAQRHQERADHRGQRGRRRRLRRRRHRPGRLAGRPALIAVGAIARRLHRRPVRPAAAVGGPADGDRRPRAGRDRGAADAGERRSSSASSCSPASARG